VVFLLNAATFVWSMVFVLRVRVPAATRPEPATPEPGDEAQDAGPGFLSETLAGFRTIGRDRDLLVVTVEICAQTLVAGAGAVFMVVMAVDILQTGPKGVGYLNSVFGIGAIIGGFVAIARSSHRTLAQDMTVGVVLWALPLLLVTAWAAPLATFAAVVLLGFGNPLVDVNMDTIVQRIVPDEVMGRVFGALEAVLIGTMALGSVLMPFLIEWLGLRTSLAALGILVTVVALLGLPRMRGLDRRLRVPTGLPLLQAVPMFSPLAPSVVETLANRLVAVQVPAGAVVLREGEESDRFYVIETGLVEVTQAGAVLRREGPGDFFGEIGLLRDVPRTATITAVEDTTLQALERDDFLAAVTGQREARRVADEVVSRRLTV